VESHPAAIAATSAAVQPRLSRWEIAAGIVVPILAAAAQYSVLQYDLVGPWLAWGSAAFGIGALLAATNNSLSPRARSIVCGANFGCAAGWILCAIDHFFDSYFFAWPVTFVTLVLMPCAPLHVSVRRALMLLRPSSGVRWVYVALGAFIAFVPPAAAQYLESRWIVATVMEMAGTDAKRVAAAVRAVNRYPLRFGRFGYDVCQEVVFASQFGRHLDWNSSEELTRELVGLLGPHPEHCQVRDPHG